MTSNLSRGKTPLILSMMTVALLAACGGGSESSDTQEVLVTDTPAVSVADAPADSTQAVSSADVDDINLVSETTTVSGTALFGAAVGAADTLPGGTGSTADERVSTLAVSAVTTTWTRIASERSAFTTSGPTVVRYGAGTRWVSRTVSGSGMCTNTFFGSDPAYGVAKTCEAQASTAPTAEWTRVAVEGGSFRTSTARQVRYGTGTRWTVKTVTGDARCSNTFFGTDPAVGSTKVCEVNSATAPAPAPAPVPVPVPAPAPSPSPVPGAVVTDADMMLKLVSSDAFSRSRWGAHCDGFKDEAPSLAEPGHMGPAYQGSGQVLKLGKATVPDGQGTQALLFRAQPNNVYHGGSPRCEVYFRDAADMLPRNKTFYHAFSLWMGDWSGADDMMSVTQWFHGLTGAGLNPPFVMVARGNRLYGQIRHSQVTPTMTKADQVGVRIFDIEGGFYKRWLNVVVQAHVTPYHNRGGFMKVWINGQQVADYKGPIGYAADGALERVVHGVYPLTKGSIPFDLRVPVRDMYLGKSVVTVDTTSRFTAQDVAATLAR